MLESPRPEKSRRIDSVDLVRGAVMVIMALDHTRDLFSTTGFLFDPTDLTRTTPALFVTRWITHFCAPVFAFLAGTGAYLALRRGKSKNQLACYLLTRGVFLILLDPIVIRHSWFPNLDFTFTWGQIIWVIGWSLVMLAGLVYLPLVCTAAMAVAMIAGHNLLDAVQADSFGAWANLWRALHIQGPIQPVAGFTFAVLYPLIPWPGVVWSGYAFGWILTHESLTRRRAMVMLGAALTLGFVAIRAMNGYGDASHWSGQPDRLFTVFSFFNCSKYPPSLLFLLMTLGPAIVALGLLSETRGAFVQFLVTFGRVPLFFYLLHMPFILTLALAFSFARYGENVLKNFPDSPPADYGYGLPIVYAVWVFVVLSLFPLCRWYGGVKRRRSDWWLGYL